MQQPSPAARPAGLGGHHAEPRPQTETPVQPEGGREGVNGAAARLAMQGGATFHATQRTTNPSLGKAPINPSFGPATGMPPPPSFLGLQPVLPGRPDTALLAALRGVPRVPVAHANGERVPVQPTSQARTTQAANEATRGPSAIAARAAGTTTSAPTRGEVSATAAKSVPSQRLRPSAPKPASGSRSGGSTVPVYVAAPSSSGPHTAVPKTAATAVVSNNASKPVTSKANTATKPATVRPSAPFHNVITQAPRPHIDSKEVTLLCLHWLQGSGISLELKEKLAKELLVAKELPSRIDHQGGLHALTYQELCQRYGCACPLRRGQGRTGRRHTRC
eukprot:scaffold1637_cov410-Prasinococcus_capsulatus_cf.AAC.30